MEIIIKKEKKCDNYHKSKIKQDVKDNLIFILIL